MDLKPICSPLIVSFFFNSLLAAPVRADFSLEEINSIARQTTVLIAPALTPSLREDLENNRNNPLHKEGLWNPGSGVIIGKQGKKYYVLTVAHNFFQRHLDTPKYWQDAQGKPYYGIRTWDGQVHVVTGVNDGRSCPLQGQPDMKHTLVRFGCRDRFIPGTDTVARDVRGADQVKGIDIAIITFKSDRDYAVATLGDASQVNPGDIVYISGWPDPEKELDPVTNQCRGRQARRQRRLAWGPVTAKVNPDPNNAGYSIFYTDNTRAGMSGGPVFDRQGRVIGNHGQGSSLKAKCGGSPNMESAANSGSPIGSGNNASSQASGQFSTLIRQFSSGQNINFFLSLMAQFSLSLPFKRDLPSQQMIQMGLTPLEQISQNNGILEFDSSQDALADPQDVVEDIYKLYSFTLESMLRDEPSGGEGSILLD